MLIDLEAREHLDRVKSKLDSLINPGGVDLPTWLARRQAELNDEHDDPRLAKVALAAEVENLLSLTVYRALDIARIVENVATDETTIDADPEEISLYPLLTIAEMRGDNWTEDEKWIDENHGDAKEVDDVRA